MIAAHILSPKDTGKRGGKKKQDEVKQVETTMNEVLEIPIEAGDDKGLFTEATVAESHDSEPSEEVASQDFLEEYNDNKQDLLDLAASISDTDSYKNRYSALQNTSFVVQLLTEQFEASGKESGFYDFVLDFCEKMKFQNGDDAYKAAKDFTTDFKIRKHTSGGEGKPPKATTAMSRPAPESIYPFTKTGEKDVDEFMDIAKELIHTRVRHLKTSIKENEEDLGRVVKTGHPREGKSYADFFANQFQFGYLKEKRFQELYFMLSQIAQAKKDGLSKKEIIQRIDATYRIDVPNEPQVQVRVGKTSNKTQREKLTKTVPFNAYSDKQHCIISVAARITRTYYENKIFRRTGALAVDLVNKFHEVPQGTISERTFYNINLSGLQKDDKKNATVYAILIDVVNFVFQGMSEDEIMHRLCLDKRMPPLPQNKAIAIDSQRSNTKTAIHSSCPTGRTALIVTIKECGMLTKTRECINLAVYLDSTLNSSIKLTEKDYYKTLKSVIEAKQMNSFNSHILSFILDCKIKDVPDVSMRSFVESKFPSAYRNRKDELARKPKGKQRKT